MRSNLAKNVGKTHRNKVAKMLALISEVRDVMSIKGGSPQQKGKAMKATYKGQEVRILGIDSDPSALVWIVFTNNPDRDAMVSRDELVIA